MKMNRKERTESREEQKVLFFEKINKSENKSFQQKNSSFSVPGRRNAMVIGRFILIDHTDDILRSL